MNFSEEQAKPLYVVQNPPLESFRARETFDSLLRRDLVIEAGPGRFMVKPAALEAMPELLRHIVPDADEQTERELIIARFKAVPDHHYRFLDGVDFTGAEAAREVERATERGLYFLRLEKRVLEIVRAARERKEF